MPGWVRNLTARHWSWLHFKAVALVWVALLLRFTPDQIESALGVVVVALAAVTIVGAMVSMVGIVMSAQPGLELTGVGIELGGLIFMAAGPVSYFGTQLYLAINLPTGDQRYALVVLSWLVCAALICRLVIVVPRWRRLRHAAVRIE